MNRLKELRLKRGLSQKALAEKLGTTQQAISLYEKGEREPSLEMWQKLAAFFGISVPYLQVRCDHLTKKEALQTIHEIMTICGISKEELKDRL